MPQDLTCRVDAHRAVAPHLKILTLRPHDSQARVPLTWKPGQFVMIDPPTPAFLLRRPMSVMRVHEDGRFDVFYRVCGRGTALMAALAPGDTVRALGALGRGFTMSADVAPAQVLLVGGGIGVAPLVMFADAITTRDGGPPPFCLYGARSAPDLGVADALAEQFSPERLAIATDDGSQGFHGNVADWMRAHSGRLADIRQAKICGPTPMMRAVCDWLRAFNPAIALEASLEIMMPCGTGACGGCVTFRRDGALPVKTCVEGPVFNPDTIIWPGDAAPGPVGISCQEASCPP